MKFLKLFMALFFVGNLFSATVQEYTQDIKQYRAYVNQYNVIKGDTQKKKEAKIKNINLRIELLNKIRKNLVSDKIYIEENGNLKNVPSDNSFSLDNFHMSSDNESRIRIALTDEFSSAEKINTLLTNLNEDLYNLSTYGEVIKKKYNDFLEPYRPSINKMKWLSFAGVVATFAFDAYINKFSIDYNDARYLQNATHLFAILAIISRSL